MIPSLEEIIRMLIAGECSSSQATAWLKQHEELAADRVAEDRRMFAAMAMQGYCAREASIECDAEAIANDACMVADALLAALATGAH
jgi:hypothetical protein